MAKKFNRLEPENLAPWITYPSLVKEGAPGLDQVKYLIDYKLDLLEMTATLPSIGEPGLYALAGAMSGERVAASWQSRPHAQLQSICAQNSNENCMKASALFDNLSKQSTGHSTHRASANDADLHRSRAPEHDNATKSSNQMPSASFAESLVSCSVAQASALAELQRANLNSAFSAP
ncbi:MAG: hypothetical protein EOO81_13045 [Oxalobacteraceae bacterium]|nr:MAG: hypothetical protein EOO81_13045 [Oxalobacteraceae bacterium]